MIAELDDPTPVSIGPDVRRGLSKLTLSMVELFREQQEQRAAGGTGTAELGPLWTRNLPDRDSPLDEETDGSPVVVTTRGQQTDHHARARAKLLAMADGYLRAGSLRQALEMYFDLMDGYPDTPEARQAEERTLEVAYRHEQMGEMRLARAIYERLA
jgi:hypothetical protein